MGLILIHLCKTEPLARAPTVLVAAFETPILAQRITQSANIMRPISEKPISR